MARYRRVSSRSSRAPGQPGGGSGRPGRAPGRPGLLEVFSGIVFGVTEAARQVYGERLVSLALFGSVAVGRPRPDSDVNLFVVANGLPAGRAERMEEFGRVEALLGHALDEAHARGVFTHLSPVIRTPAEMEKAGPPFIDMILDSRVLYDSQGFFAAFAERFRQHLETTGAEFVSDRGPAHWRARPFSAEVDHARMVRSYLFKAQARLAALDFLFGRGAYSDVVREAQEVAEISLKAILWGIGVEPPRVHNVGPVILSYRRELPAEIYDQAHELARISRWLDRERQFAFYGGGGLVPTAEYGEVEARRAIDDARVTVKAAEACAKG